MDEPASAGASLIQGIKVTEIIRLLDGLHAQEWVVMHFALGLENRLEGQAAFLLAPPLRERAEMSAQHAKILAARISDLGGAVTADPTRFVEMSPLKRFSMPSSNSDVRVILTYALEQERRIVSSYGELLRAVKDKDEVTHQQVLHILADEVRVESDLETALHQ
jgi:bacterioferritin